MTDAVVVRPMTAGDLGEATRIFRAAFATFLEAPDPTRFRLDMRTIETRFATDPGTAFVAERGGRLLGSVIGMDWGSQFVVGPLSVDPSCWGQGMARLLTEAILDAAERRKPALVSLFTHPGSPTHLRLYESFGFVPMFLAPVMSKPVEGAVPTRPVSCFSAWLRCG